MQTYSYFQVEYIILTEDAFPCSKVELVRVKDNSGYQQTSSCCRWLGISNIYERFFLTKESQYDDDDDDDNGEITKEDILVLEDNVIEELQELRKEMEEQNKNIENRHASMREELRKILCILETIQQKVGP